MGCTTLDLREKDVINVCDGQKLGRVAELEIDIDCGKVTALIVAPEGLCSLFSTKHHVRVPWDDIKKMGKDTILVELPAQLTDSDGMCGVKNDCRKEKKRHLF
ncbi:MAG: YlmC/YmxH family sporulation protein [Clostridia bacterium]|nr:YlmC/YmxH family sporulation protein [Clostridia bacterium]